MQWVALLYVTILYLLLPPQASPICLPFLSQLVILLHWDTWMNQKRISQALTIMPTDRPLSVSIHTSLSHVSMDELPCFWKRLILSMYTGVMPSQLRDGALATLPLPFASWSPPPSVIHINIQSCCYFSHHRNPLALSPCPAAHLTFLSLSCKTPGISCLYQPPSMSLPDSLLNPF